MGLGLCHVQARGEGKRGAEGRFLFHECLLMTLVIDVLIDVKFTGKRKIGFLSYFNVR